MKTRKELQEEYKQRKPQMGVFQIKNLQSKSLFIDASTDVNAKWNRYRVQLNFGTHPNKKLQTDWSELGAENFEFGILSEMEYKNEGTSDYKKELKLLKELIMDEIKYEKELQLYN